MKNSIKLFLIGFVMIIFSCKNEHKKKDTEHGEKHWNYEGETSPKHWAEIEKNSDCDGTLQSPINIIEIDAKLSAKKEDLQILYSAKTKLTEVKNNGHSIEFNFEYGDSLLYKTHTYHLKQIHFHEPSEHTLDGVRFPIEIHLVHSDTEEGYTVISILGKQGEKNEPFNLIESFLPLELGETKEFHKSVDLRNYFPKNKDYFSYDGSLTTPPCTEGVDWIIFKEPIILSESQVHTLKDNMPLNNYRDEQPLNNRKVYLNSVMAAN